MPPEQADAAYLWDMREAAREALRFLEGLNFEGFIADRMVRLAVERELEIIGEAARRVSREFQEAHSDLPWRQIIGQRNVLAHEYGEINAELIWNVAKERLPELIRQLGAAIPADPEDKD